MNTNKTEQASGLVRDLGPAAGVAIFRFDPDLLWLGMFGLGAATAAAILPFSGSRPLAEPEWVADGDG